MSTNRKKNPGFSSLLFIIILFSIQLMCIDAKAVTYQINFGGALGFSYSPNQLSVSVGDTVKWVGDLASHPLSSTTVPSGASSWHVTSGSSSSYAVPVAGNYTYHCDFHAANGMTGSFNALDLGSGERLKQEYSPALNLVDIAPNPSFDDNVTIHFTLAEPQRITLKLYSMCGDKVLTLARGFKEAGDYWIIVLSGHLASGIYVCKLEGKASDTRRLLCVR